MSLAAIRTTRVALILGVILLWELYAQFLATSTLTAAPSQVLEQFWPKVLGEPRVIDSLAGKPSRRLRRGLRFVELALYRFSRALDSL